MTFIVANEGVEFTGQTLRTAWYNTFYVGLFRNDFNPHHSMTLASFQPANFSGYVGPRVINSFTSITFDGVRAILTGAQILWLHDGGPVAGLVFGYYVQTAAGVLLGAERQEPPAWLVTAGQGYRVVPHFTTRSEF